ncbi:AbrB family transcriptional regulator [Brevibacillus sp. TJ4]|uniref:AbrB family transcriptional regulator n=1 Tax=Brevibacillus sp. TJ4 TaxID=3234853 RepID=UPI0037CDE010
MLLRTLATLLIGSMGGLLFAAIHSPLPWLLGALVTTVVVKVLGYDKLWAPRWLRSIGLVVVGISLGLRMTPAIMETMTDHIGLMLLATFITLLFGLINMLIMHKMADVDWVTAFISNVPGGLSEMLSIGEKVGGNQQIISIFHSIRVVVIVLSTPFLVTWLYAHPLSAAASVQNGEMGLVPTLLILAAGAVAAVLATRISIPAPYMLGPMLLTAVLCVSTNVLPEDHALPAFLVQVAQVLIGVSTGLQFSREDIIKHRRLFSFALVHAFLLLGMTLTLALSISYLTSTDVITNILATSPGGLTEMGLMALSVGADPLLVMAFQLFRVLFILFAVSYGVRAWLKRYRKEEFS